MKPLVIYHGNCQDGFAAAWCVRHAFGDCDFVPGVYQNPPPDVTDRNIIMVDFSYKRYVIDEMAKLAKSILILDHHKSAAEDLCGVPPPPPWILWVHAESIARRHNGDLPLSVLFDMNRSGAGLAWDYFHPRTRRPRLIDHIEDRDLWRFALPSTREISAALFSYPYDFQIWDTIMIPDHTAFLTSEGRAIERKHHKDVAELIGVTRREMVIGGIRMPVANLPYTLTSDAGHKMAAEADGVACCYWDTPDGRVFSLRSTDSGPDVQAIAVRYGGGGHAHAAGFRMPIGWEGEEPNTD